MLGTLLKVKVKAEKRRFSSKVNLKAMPERGNGQKSGVSHARDRNLLTLWARRMGLQPDCGLLPASTQDEVVSHSDRRGTPTTSRRLIPI